MGQLVDGVWHDTWYDTSSTGGEFRRSTSKFRNWITTDGSAGPSGAGGFRAESGRYHLYVSHACPWAHRTMIFRKLKQLEPHVGVSVVHPDMLSDGWTFATDGDGATGDALFGAAFLRDIYIRNDPKVTGRVTVPVLWDKKQGTIVSNESSEIIRMFNSAFDGITGNTDDYWPEALRDRIEPINARIYDTLNNGGSTRRASPRPRRPMMRLSGPCSTRSTGSRIGCRLIATSWAARSRRRTGGCLPR